VKAGATSTPTPVEAISRFMIALAEQWVANHNKPVITTTFFAEGLPRLQGSHYDYPSGRQAARVIIKLVEYKEYLEKVGTRV
jgi:hypothetical protein